MPVSSPNLSRGITKLRKITNKNIFYSFISFVFLTFGLAAICSAESDRLSLPFIIGSKKILIIGESYGQPESSQFVSESVSEYVNSGGCLKVGLEISSDQQETLDSAMKGEVSVSEIQINDIIDSAAYRRMLFDLSAQIKAGKCLSVHAIGPGLGSGIQRRMDGKRGS